MKNGLNELVRKTSGNISPFQVPLPCSAIKYKMQMNKENESKLSNLKGHSSRDLSKDLNINVVFNKEEINQLKYVQQQLVNKIYEGEGFRFKIHELLFIENTPCDNIVFCIPVFPNKNAPLCVKYPIIKALFQYP